MKKVIFEWGEERLIEDKYTFSGLKTIEVVELPRGEKANYDTTKIKNIVDCG